MRRALIPLLVLLVAPVSANEAAGLLVFKSSPDSGDDTARVLEFARAEKEARATTYVPQGSETEYRVYNNQIVSLIFYPTIAGGTFITPEEIAPLRETAEEMKRTASRFPAALQPLTEPYRAVQAALEKIDQGMVLVSGEWKPREEIGKPAMATGETLTITLPDGSEKTFENVKITGKTLDTLQIMHSGGASGIPYEQLPPEVQKEHGFDPEKIAEVRKAEAEAKAEMATVEAATETVSDSDTGETAGGSTVLSAELKAIVAQFEEGVSQQPFSEERRQELKQKLAALAPYTSSTGVLEKRKQYLIADGATTCTISTKFQDAFLLTGLDGRPIATVVVERAELLDGVKFADNFVICLGTYLQDSPNGTPVFLGHFIAGPDPLANNLITIRMP